MKRQVHLIFVLCVLGFPFVLPNIVLAKKKIDNAQVETYQNIIEKAQNLMLQKNRSQAQDILSNAAQKETNLAAIKELKKTAIEISNIFMTEKTHQLYENALSQRYNNVNEALNKINEAIKLEPTNFLLKFELGSLLIAKKDCKAAEANALSMREVLPFYEKVDLALAQAHLCAEQLEAFKKVIATVNTKKSEDEYAWLVLEFKASLQQGSFLAAQEKLKTLINKYKDYPEIPYLQWKMSQAKQKPENDLAQKYLHQCKAISMSVYRKYLADSTLCRNVLEVEAEAKGLNNETE